MILWLAPELATWLGESETAMRRVFAIEGEVFREPPGARRRTLRFEQAGRPYFLKLHWGVGWGEIIKNLITLKRPVLGARNEWEAIDRLRALGIETMEMVGYGEAGRNPARQRSFVITRELEGTISLEDYCAEWRERPPVPTAKWALIRRVAEMTAALHSNGLNHRDLYICHFLLQQPWRGADDPLRLYLIDLHRVQQRAAVPRRWLVKDLGALFYSALHIGLTRRDLFRFVRWYTGEPLRSSLEREAGLWQDVVARARRLATEGPTVEGVAGDG